MAPRSLRWMHTPPWLCGLAALALLAPLLRSQDFDERAIRVAYVFNLTKFVEWSDPTRPLVVGFVGDGPMGDALEQLLNGKTSGARAIHVVLAPKDGALQQCDVVYVGYASPKKLRATLDQLRSRSVLTVGDTDSFSRDGGMIGLVRAGQQVRLEINLDALERGKLKISSRVLSLATIVHDPPGARN